MATRLSTPYTDSYCLSRFRVIVVIRGRRGRRVLRTFISSIHNTQSQVRDSIVRNSPLLYTIASFIFLYTTRIDFTSLLNSNLVNGRTKKKEKKERKFSKPILFCFASTSYFLFFYASTNMIFYDIFYYLLNLFVTIFNVISC